MAGASALADRVNDLVDKLGLTQEEIGRIVDASGRSVSRWTSGDTEPQRLSKQRLIELAYVADSVTQVLPRERANLWIFTPNRLLDHQSPADKIAAGKYLAVMHLIEAMADGVIV